MANLEKKELQVKPDDLIVTKTDLNGKITYCNDAFMEYSGFYEEELLGQSHDFIRHSDMPKSFFHFMQDTLKQENEFLGFIKNKRKNGGCFWTFISVTPSFDAKSQLLGYFSVHRSPKPDAINFFKPVYAEMCTVEAEHSHENYDMEQSLAILMQSVNRYGDYNEHVSSYYK